MIHHQKEIISPQNCARIPQNRSFNHVYLTFSLRKIIYALLSKNVASGIFALLLAKFAKVPGLGGGGSTQFWQCQDFGCIWTPNPPLTAMPEAGGCAKGDRADGVDGFKTQSHCDQANNGQDQ